MSEATQSRSSRLLKQLLAVVVLLIAAVLLIKAIVGFISGIFYLVVILAALGAVIWAYTTLKR